MAFLTLNKKSKDAFAVRIPRNKRVFLNKWFHQKLMELVLDIRLQLDRKIYFFVITYEVDDSMAIGS